MNSEAIDINSTHGNRLHPVTDQLGKLIHLPLTPRRIVSLVPSQTELLFDLGLNENVVGITKFCIHPSEWFRTKTRVGGTKKINIDIIRNLRPDLVIANKEENTLEDVSAIEEFCPVWTSNISSCQEAIDMIKRIAEITQTGSKADDLINAIEKEFSSLSFTYQYRTAYMIWKDPWMAAGGDSFISDMMKACGFINILQHSSRYPTISWEDLKQNNIEVLLLSSEPYPFDMKHLEEISKILPEVEIRLVDGEMFSWYGSRLLLAPGHFRTLRKTLSRG